MNTIKSNKLVLKSFTSLSNERLLEALDLDKEDIKEIVTTDYYNYTLDEGKVYEYTLYEVKL